MEEIDGIINDVKIAFMWQIPKDLEYMWHALFHVTDASLQHECKQ